MLGFGDGIVSRSNINPASALRLVQGPTLDMNAAEERFANDDAANRLLKREYRAPYFVPNEV